MTPHDFGDGIGPVHAHQHANGGGWVADTANVDATAYVGPNARVCGDAWVKTSTDYLTLGPIGSRESFLTWTRSDNSICTGCFRGTVAEFLRAVKETHGDNYHAKAYRAAVRFIRAYAKQEDAQ